VEDTILYVLVIIFVRQQSRQTHSENISYDKLALYSTGRAEPAEKYFCNYVILCTSSEQADALIKTFPALPAQET